VHKIPLVDVKAQYAPLIPELEERFREILAGGQFIRGPHFWEFQKEAAAFLGVKDTIGVANGTDALVIVLDALEIGPGDEVICPAFTFYATAESIARRGATPVFAEIDPVTLNIDPEDVAAKITERTRAIMPVHLFGRPADMESLSQLGLPVIEDAAQAFGAPGVAELGAISTYSFFPTKNLFCLGDGGLVATSDEALAERVRVLAFHGSRDKVDFDLVGYNSRLDELQAAILRVKLGHLDAWLARRREIAARYTAALGGLAIATPREPDGRRSSWHQYTIRSPERDALRARLAGDGIESAVHYPSPPFAQPALAGYDPAAYPIASRLAAEVLSLPLYAELDDGDVDRVARAVRRFVESR
jgi:dTDP-4-amino-4,6-dideoxygalactose transaminase